MKLQGWKESKTIDADITVTRDKNNLNFALNYVCGDVFFAGMVYTGSTIGGLPMG